MMRRVPQELQNVDWSALNTDMVMMVLLWLVALALLVVSNLFVLSLPNKQEKKKKSRDSVHEQESKC
jgi:hypothetical protein